MVVTLKRKRIVDLIVTSSKKRVRVEEVNSISLASVIQAKKNVSIQCTKF